MSVENVDPAVSAVERTLASLGATTPPRRLSLSVLERVGIVDSYGSAETPVGTVYVAFNQRGVSRVDRAEDGEAFELDFAARVGRPARRAGLPRAIGRALETGRGGTLRYDLRGLTPFERAVLTVTLRIPPGEVRSYTWVAHHTGHPRAVRAAGSALAGNPIPLLIPCHRVVRRDGHIGEYGLGGPANKRLLLGHEGLDPDELERLASRGVRLVGSQTARVACLPTCRHARRITPAQRVELHSLEEANRRGFRPCTTCLPI